MPPKTKNIIDFENEIAEKKTAKSKNNIHPKSGFNYSDLKNILILKDETARKILGLLLVCFALFSFASLFSFIIYYKSDLSILQGISENIYETRSDFEIKNWMGSLGAKFAYNVMYKGFGILSFIIPIFSIHFGVYLMVEKKNN